LNCESTNGNVSCSPYLSRTGARTVWCGFAVLILRKPAAHQRANDEILADARILLTYGGGENAILIPQAEQVKKNPGRVLRRSRWLGSIELNMMGFG
jgi:hypothetical protein